MDSWIIRENMWISWDNVKGRIYIIYIFIKLSGIYRKRGSQTLGSCGTPNLLYNKRPDKTSSISKVKVIN